jgi:transcriptional regulator with XRE-family HTH domain
VQRIVVRMELGSVLRQARLEAGLTQESVARAVGVTPQALCRWESGARPVRSDQADRVLAACGRDARVRLVPRHADLDAELQRLAGLTVRERVRTIRGLLDPGILLALQQTGAVVFTGLWAAASLGLPALSTEGGLLLGDVGSDQAAVAAVLAPFHPQSLAPGGPWGVTWDDEVFVRHPVERWRANLLGCFTSEVVADPGAEVSVPVPGGRWRVVEPSRLVPDTVDASVLDRWRAARAT